MVIDMQNFTLAAVVDVADAVMNIAAALDAKPGVISTDIAMMIARDCVKSIALKNLALLVQDDVQMLYDMHVVEYGEIDSRAKLYEVETWVVQLEANWLEFIDNYAGVLSAHWLGTADTKTPRSQAEVLGVCSSFAEEVYKNITYIHDHDNPREKTDAQVLSAVGILRDHIETLLAGRKATVEPQKEEVPTMMNYDLKQVVQLLHDHASMMGYTGPTLLSILDNACDADNGLAASGMAALGMDTGEATLWVMRDAARRYGLEHFAVMVENNSPAAAQEAPPAAATPAPALQPTFAPPPAPAAPAPPAVPVAQYEFATASDGKAIRRLQAGGDWEYVPDAPAPAAPKPVAAATAQATQQQAGNIPAEALDAIKRFTGIKGEDLGSGLGVSRATFDNYCKGKGAKLQATEANKTFLLKVADEHLAALQYARNAIASV